MRQWKEPPLSCCNSFWEELLNTDSGYKTSTHFWPEQPVQLTGELNNPSDHWELTASAQSISKVHNGRNILNLKRYLIFFLPFGSVRNIIPIYPEQSSLSILYHMPYCCTWSRGNWNFLMQQSPDNSNTASVEWAGAIAVYEEVLLTFLLRLRHLKKDLQV